MEVFLRLRRHGKVSVRVPDIKEASIQDYYSRPVNAYAARFFGCRNFLEAEKSGSQVTSPLDILDRRDCDLPDGKVLLGIRAEAAKDFHSGNFRGQVRKKLPHSAARTVILCCEGAELELLVPYYVPLNEGEWLRFSLDESGLFCVPPEDD